VAVALLAHGRVRSCRLFDSDASALAEEPQRLAEAEVVALLDE
jgi:hypothetical protein